MAGIGFRLQSLFSDGNIVKNVRGSLYSLIIATGPWLISIISIALVSSMAQRNLSNHDLMLFKCIISYTYALSLILFGIVEMPLTRYLADQLFRADHSTFKSVVLSMVSVYLIIAIPLTILLYYFAPGLSLISIISCMTFLISVLITWTAMIFLSAAKHYHPIIISFVGGGALSYFLATFLGKKLGFEGYVFGYTLGQIFLSMSLLSSVFNEFRTHNYISMSFLHYYKRFQKLILVGVFYYLGIWVDKFIFWFGPESQKIQDIFHTNQFYDTAMFLSYLTIIPAMTIFLVQIETNFAKAYHYYYQAIENKFNYAVINETLSDIIKSIQRGSINLLKVQVFLSILAWYFSGEIIELLSLPSLMIPIFRYGVLASLMQVLLLLTNIVLLYFLENTKVLFHYGLFLFLNASLTYISTKMGYQYYGAGYFVSALITFSVSFVNLNRTLDKLNFKTFMQQPIYQGNK
jgi:polysaccharide biosynthesis protein PelG